MIDDHTRLAYVEVHPQDRGEIAAAVLTRAAGWMHEQGCGPVQAVMTDNAFVYTNTRTFAAALHRLDARHIRIPPRTPHWNGKAERFIRSPTKDGHGRIWPSSTRCGRALSSFLRCMIKTKSGRGLSLGLFKTKLPDRSRSPDFIQPPLEGHAINAQPLRPSLRPAGPRIDLQDIPMSNIAASIATLGHWSQPRTTRAAARVETDFGTLAASAGDQPAVTRLQHAQNP